MRFISGIYTKKTQEEEEEEEARKHAAPLVKVKCRMAE